MMTTLRLPPSSTHRDLACASLIYLLLAILVTWPVALQLPTQIAGDPNRDNLQFVWNLWWIQEALINQGNNPANVTVMHWPDGGSNQLLSLSVLIPILALPVTLLTGPIFSYNLWLLLSFPLAGAGGWLLTYYVTSERRAAFIGGLVFGLAPHKSLQATGHFLQIMVFLFPLYAIALQRLLRRPTLRQSLVTGILLGLSLLVKLVHVGFFLLPLSVLLLLHHLWRDRGWWRGRGPFLLAGTLLIALLFTAPVLIPFLASSASGNLSHYHLPGVVSFSADLLSYVTPSPHHPLLQNELFEAWSAFLLEGNLEENVGYMGFTVLALAVLGGLRQRRAAAPWLWMTIVMAILSLGPFLKIGGRIVGAGSGPVEIDGVRAALLLPYAGLMQLPFYEWGRTPSRQIMVAMLALAVLAGLGIASLRHRPRLARRVMVLATILITIEYLIAWPYPSGSAALYHDPIWREIRQEARGAVLSLPQWDFFSFPPSNESLLAQTAHGQPIVGGYIHRLPPGSAQTAKAIQELVLPPVPDDIVPRPTGRQALVTLRSLGIASVLLHRDARSGDLWNDEHDRAVVAVLREWGGPPRWSNGRLELYDLPDVALGPVPPLWTLDPRWHAPEQGESGSWRWMPDEAAIWLRLPAARAARLRIEAQSFHRSRTVVVRVGEKTILSVPLFERTVIETPPIQLARGHNEITLSLPEGCERPTDLDPQAGDGRCLGLLVYDLSLLPANP